jgi:hypothetical protein
MPEVGVKVGSRAGRRREVELRAETPTWRCYVTHFIMKPEDQAIYARDVELCIFRSVS